MIQNLIDCIPYKIIYTSGKQEYLSQENTWTKKSTGTLVSKRKMLVTSFKGKISKFFFSCVKVTKGRRQRVGSRKAHSFHSMCELKIQGRVWPYADLQLFSSNLSRLYLTIISLWNNYTVKSLRLDSVCSKYVSHFFKNNTSLLYSLPRTQWPLTANWLSHDNVFRN